MNELADKTPTENKNIFLNIKWNHVFLICQYTVSFRTHHDHDYLCKTLGQAKADYFMMFFCVTWEIDSVFIGEGQYLVSVLYTLYS